MTAELLPHPWRDISSFSQSDIDRTPRTWRAAYADFQLTLTRHHHFRPDQWVASCYGVFDPRAMDSCDVSEAAREAQSIMRERLANALEKLNLDS